MLLVGISQQSTNEPLSPRYRLAIVTLSARYRRAVVSRRAAGVKWWSINMYDDICGIFIYPCLNKIFLC